MKRKPLTLIFVLALVLCIFMQQVNSHAALNSASDTEFLNSEIEMIKQSYQGDILGRSC